MSGGRARTQKQLQLLCLSLSRGGHEWQAATITYGKIDGCLREATTVGLWRWQCGSGCDRLFFLFIKIYIELCS